MPQKAGPTGSSGSAAQSDPSVPEVGVGPWEGPLPAGEHFDPELLATGDRRNVVDEFRYWKLEAIVAELDTRRHDFHIAIENWHHDFNIGSVRSEERRVGKECKCRKRRNQ